MKYVDLNFLTYSDAQLIETVINRFVAAGYTDILGVQTQFNKYVQAEGKRLSHREAKRDDKEKFLLAKGRATKERREKAERLQKAPDCPECGEKMVIEAKVIDYREYEFVLNCKHGCSYSEYVGTEQDLKKRLKGIS